MRFTAKVVRVGASAKAVAVETPYALIANVPGPVGAKLRYLYWKRRCRKVGRGAVFGIGVRISNPGFVTIGDRAWIDDGVLILAGPLAGSRNAKVKSNPNYPGGEGEVHIGENCHICPRVVLQGHAGVWIGDNCGIAGGSSIYSVSHHYQDQSGHGRSYVLTSMAPAEQQYLISAPCVVEDGAALGMHSVMLPGATVKRGSWVGVHSLVLGEIGPNVVATGNPAKPVKPIQR